LGYTRQLLLLRRDLLSKGDPTAGWQLTKS
jgi:hypothetical protein